MIVLFPIGGTGERFRQAGYCEPKPFIRIGGEELFRRVLACYPDPSGRCEYLYVVREEYRHGFPKDAYTLRQKTRGPLETILSHKDLVKKLDASKDSLLVADCDSLIERDELEKILRDFEASGASGGVTIRQSSNPSYSYAKIDGIGKVLETREKDPFTDWHTTGPYWWKSACDFIRYGTLALGEGIISICPVYNQAIREGKKVIAVRTETFIHLGTPEELEAYAKRQGFKLVKGKY